MDPLFHPEDTRGLKAETAGRITLRRMEYEYDRLDSS